MNTSEFGFIREENEVVSFIKKKDYKWGLDNCPIDQEVILYDFSLMVGDTIDYCNYEFEEDDPIIISEINNEMQFGETRKVYQYNTPDNFIIEGIGQNRGPFRTL